MIDWTTIHVGFGTKTVNAGSNAEFSVQLPAITDDMFVVSFTPYVTGIASADCMISGSYRGFVNGEDTVRFMVKNTSSANRTWNGWAHITYIS